MNLGDDEEVLEVGYGRRRGGWRPAAALAVVAVVAAGIWLNTRSSSAPRPTALSSRPTRSTPASATSRPDLPLPPANMRYPWDCPAEHGCVTSRGVSARLLSTLRRYVPHARGASGYTIALSSVRGTGRAIWFRRVTARAHRLSVIVIVSSAEVERAAPAVTDLASMAYVRALVRRFVIQVQVDGQRRDRPSVRDLQRMCRDRGLTMVP